MEEDFNGSRFQLKQRDYPDEMDIKEVNRRDFTPSAFTRLFRALANKAWVAPAIGVSGALIPSATSFAEEIPAIVRPAASQPDRPLFALDTNPIEERRVVTEGQRITGYRGFEIEDSDILYNERGELLISDPGQRFILHFDRIIEPKNLKIVPDGNIAGRDLIVVSGRDIIMTEKERQAETPEEKEVRENSVYFTTRGVIPDGEGVFRVYVADPRGDKNPREELRIAELRYSQDVYKGP